MPLVRHLRIRGVAVAFLFLLGCQGQPAPAPPSQPAEAAHPTPAPPAPDDTILITPPKPERYVPPIVGKSRPEVRVPPLRTIVWDMGVVPPGTKKEHRFAIQNDSQVHWTVRFVSPDCKCAVGEFTAKTVKPGETTHLAVSFRTDTREGNFLGSIGVDFMEVEAPRFMLFLKAEVRKPLAAVPAAVDLGRVGPADKVTHAVEVRNYSEADIAPPTVDAPPWLRVELKPVAKKKDDDRARQTWELAIHADLAGLKSAADPGALVVRAADALGTLTIPLSLKMKAPLEPSPAEVVFENYKPGELAERTFLLETYPDLATLTEQDLMVSHDLGDELTVSVVKKLGPNRFQLTARYRPAAAYATVEGELTVAVRGRDVPPARIKVRGKRSI